MPRPSLIKVCTVDDCASDHYAKGLCKSHYMSANRNKFNPKNEPKAEFDYNDFWEFVKKELQIG